MTFRLPAGALATGLALATVSALFAADPALTIYNQNFAVVRETVPLTLAAGVNRIRHTGLTAQVQPDSVILRDPAGRVNLEILEQNFLADPVSLDALLSAYEGKSIDFQLNDGRIVSGRIVRTSTAAQPGLTPVAVARPSQALIESEASCVLVCRAYRCFRRSPTTPF